MWDRILERFLNSIADASYWVVVIVAIGTTGIFLFEKIVNFFLADIDKAPSKKEGEEE